MFFEQTDLRLQPTFCVEQMFQLIPGDLEHPHQHLSRVPRALPDVTGCHRCSAWQLPCRWDSPGRSGHPNFGILGVWVSRMVWAPVGSAVRTESVLLTSGGIEKYPHIIPWQRDREGRCRCSVGLEGEDLEGPSQSNHCRILGPCDAVNTKIKVSSFCTLHRHSGTSVLWQNLSLEIVSLKLVSCVE